MSGASSFAFELKCLELLLGLGFDCRHSGFYADPVTGKHRQFDIRAVKSNGALRLYCAVECKRLSDSFPLLVSCVPRSRSESHHNVIFSFDEFTSTGSRGTFARSAGHADYEARPSGAYPGNAPVGKECVQVGRTDKGEITTNDADMFEKWSQAISSAHELVAEAWHVAASSKLYFLSVVLPIVVVPDDTLWQVNYNSNGSRHRDPFQTDRCSYLITRNEGDRISVVTHLEFVTFSGLSNLLNQVLQIQGDWFPASVSRQAEAMLRKHEEFQQQGL
ncbi:MAG: hypothetical protein SGJ19_29630 [Planctomycetia bacterium]|nr:hypothetical protein [Planctomycetia bacterium]